ncbi:hypothetical protein EVAR_388_1 [Eumeta japonica]|uniref:Uncharacterized protein n=1 Tax=Eumeta variegata TaxID=151549 RepID=A0A4C1SA67_EUMVA|nr:hypothetical protein EVAR_388_1 [Eumeta japonica]
MKTNSSSSNQQCSKYNKRRNFRFTISGTDTAGELTENFRLINPHTGDELAGYSQIKIITSEVFHSMRPQQSGRHVPRPGLARTPPRAGKEKLITQKIGSHVSLLLCGVSCPLWLCSGVYNEIRYFFFSSAGSNKKSFWNDG